MTHPPLFSVVIPTHNRAGMIVRALRSVLAQTLDDHETIVVDDGSTDGTREVQQSIQSERCRIIRHESNCGVSTARNLGVATATGEWITFLDDDDELRPNALKMLRDRLQAFPQLDFLWGGRLIHEKDGAGKTIAAREDDWHHLPCPISGTEFLPLILEIATSAAFTIRRTLYQQIGGFDPSFQVSEDRDLFMLLARGKYLGGAVCATIIDVNEMPSSLSRSAGIRAVADSDLRVMEKHREYLDHPEHQAFKSSYLLNIFAGFLQTGNRRSAMRILGELRSRGALNAGVLRKYLRHAPEFRALKSLLRYSSLRRLANQWRGRPP
jgi:glycosyltransferase involved in cell wall biosynthesis